LKELNDELVSLAGSRKYKAEEDALRDKESRATALRERVDELKAMKPGSICPTCAQPVSHFTEQAITSTAIDKEIILYEIENDKISLAKKKSAEAIEVRLLRAQIAITENALKEARMQINSLNKEQEENIRLVEQIKSKSAELKNTLTRREELVKAENHWIPLITEKRNELASHERDLMYAETVKEAAERDVQILSVWLEAFSNRGIKALLLDGIIGQLNKSANEYAGILTGNAVRIEFDSQAERKDGRLVNEFTVKTHNRSGAAVYGANSMGEKRRIDVAISLALADLLSSRSSKSFNLLILDEVFEHLDSAGIDAIMSLLRLLNKTKESVFVITHKDEFKEQFSSEIQVVRKGNEATVVGASV
jgi:DNA repair exonuclease SbcCD ATPase subunit